MIISITTKFISNRVHVVTYRIEIDAFIVVLPYTKNELTSENHNGTYQNQNAKNWTAWGCARPSKWQCQCQFCLQIYRNHKPNERNENWINRTYRKSLLIPNTRK